MVTWGQDVALKAIELKGQYGRYETYSEHSLGRKSIYFETVRINAFKPNTR